MNVGSWLLKAIWAVLLAVGCIQRDPYLMALAATFLVVNAIEEA